MVKVSVICTNYNKGNWIGEALESFLNQETAFSIEIIVIDDASTDCSIDIIKQYQSKYPHRIKAFFNNENKGITRTWIEACQKAQGQYIARCDGDDYWTDSLKLQKQVDLLESTADSKWSNTDFDMISPEGEVTQKHVLTNGIIPFIDSYEKMLALKGMTMASTWLVEADLIRQVNEEIDLEAVDDTFNIQLELFKRTKLAFLKDSTTVYRMDNESDSRTQDTEKLANRFEKLLETQLSYIDKYPDSDFKEALKLLLRQHTKYEIALSQIHNLARFNEQKVTVYFGTDEIPFSEDNILQFPMKENDTIKIPLSQGITKIRIDLSEIPSLYSTVSLLNTSSKTAIEPIETNADSIDGMYLFAYRDPFMIYDVKHEDTDTLTLTYRLFNEDGIANEDSLISRLSKLLSQKKKEISELKLYEDAYQRVSSELEEMTKRYDAVIHSRRWTIPTKIINLFRRKR
ncbi:glycosyltransferase family 2 protein [Streptococcus macacae]|uniref:Glycosyltransferase, group 2 family protein n=1 Tax=Streptococcus macacae NCTC 11558 TaxID=764298 RepID=G5JZ82_9STRE|nr:glycosyltransferase [Streptococcus macacae]EHJ52790.1 glycosyltransferase, group 2 family protein [Streptococcus macacae NCTC 11558]SUN78332.1 glycosyltransferase [Streptococcus macacae NCTC 11558]